MSLSGTPHYDPLVARTHKSHMGALQVQCRNCDMSSKIMMTEYFAFIPAVDQNDHKVAEGSLMCPSLVCLLKLALLTTIKSLLTNCILICKTIFKRILYAVLILNISKYGILGLLIFLRDYQALIACVLMQGFSIIKY